MHHPHGIGIFMLMNLSLCCAFSDSLWPFFMCVEFSSRMHQLHCIHHETEYSLMFVIWRKKMQQTCLAVRPCLRVLLLLISKSSMAKKWTTNDKVNDSPAKLLSILIPKCNTNRNELFKQKQQQKNQHNTHHFFRFIDEWTSRMNETVAIHILSLTSMCYMHAIYFFPFIFHRECTR